ncbi:MAG: acetyl-lysine deacetylase, partial [Phycisphaerales bacterium JB064]
MSASDQDAITLLQELVGTPSVSGDEHAAVQTLVQRMTQLGYRARVDEAGNAVGVIGSEDPHAVEIMLLGHIDTVPGHIPV